METRRPEASAGHIICCGHKTLAYTQETIGEVKTEKKLKKKWQSECPFGGRRKRRG
jgi:hypothetical protein